MAIPLALGLGSLASAQGVPVIDGSNLARAVSRVEELARDALRVNGGRARSATPARIKRTSIKSSLKPTNVSLRRPPVSPT